ncbi:MAG TPA: VOC family protein [Methylomirabilota bacterium]|jgi:PhnB protein
MAGKVKAIPDGYHAITPYLSIRGAANAIEFYKKAFGATERMRMAQPDGRIGHAELQIGDSCVMLADEHPEMDFRGPHSIGGSPLHLHLYVEDVDAVVAQAVGAGAKVVRAVQDQFYGDRSGTLTDPYGHVWHVATHKEDLSEEEMRKRAAAHHKG